MRRNIVIMTILIFLLKKCNFYRWIAVAIGALILIFIIYHFIVVICVKKIFVKKTKEGFKYAF